MQRLSARETAEVYAARIAKLPRCGYCAEPASDVRKVELRPDGCTWKDAYQSEICGDCRKYLYQTRQFRYLRKGR